MLNKKTLFVLYLLEAAGAVGIWFLLRPETWGERVGTVSFVLIYLVTCSTVSYFYGKIDEDMPKS